MSSLFEKETSFSSTSYEKFKGISFSKSESGMLQYYLCQLSIYLLCSCIITFATKLELSAFLAK